MRTVYTSRARCDLPVGGNRDLGRKGERSAPHEKILMPAAVIMAGGRSSRMRATHGPDHKALVHVLGVSMLERNLATLFGQGFDDVTVVSSAGEPAVAEWVRTRGSDLARAARATVASHIEREPLGTIGVLGALAADGDLLVVNVDNLSAIDLQALVREHRDAGAAMTVAVHEEPFSIPFGEVRVENGRIVEYAEKPQRRLLVSSGTYVVGRKARESIAPGKPTNVPELIMALVARGERVAAYRHDEPWIDVNDSAGVKAAESLVAANARRFSTGGAGR